MKSFGGSDWTSARPIARRGGGGNAPGGLTPFNALNATFNTVLAPLSQDGTDMPPSKVQINTWESGCRS